MKCPVCNSKYFEDFDYRDYPDFCMVDEKKEKQEKIDNEILNLIHSYAKENYIGTVIGADYINQKENNEDISDVLNLVKEILEIYAKNNEKEEE